MNRKSHKISSGGFTILEVLLAIAISSTMLAALVPYLNSINKSWAAGARQTEMLQHARIATDTIVRKLLGAGFIQVSPAGTIDYIILEDKNRTYSVTFFHNVQGSPYYIGSSGDIRDKDVVQKYITLATGATTDSLLAKSASSLSFELLPDSSQISVNISISDWENMVSKNISISTVVYPRFAVLRLNKSVKNLNTGKLYDYIQAGIDDAHAGQTLAVAKGTYGENIVMKNGVSLEGYYDYKDWVRHAYDPEYETVVDAGANGRVLMCRNIGNATYIDGFTIKNGSSSGTRRTDGGGGVYCENSDLRIRNCVIKENYGYNKGGGVYINSSSPTITDCVIETNNSGATSYGGGMAVFYNSRPIVRNCIVQNNITGTGARGGGIAISDNSSLALEDCVITNNRADSVGANAGGIWCRSSDLIMSQTSVYSNASRTRGGGLYIDRSNRFEMTNCAVAKNSAQREGGGLYTTQSTHAMLNCTIADNSTSTNGAGAYISNPNDLDMNNLIISQNRGNYGLYVTSGGNNVTVKYTDIYGHNPDEVRNGNRRGDYTDFDAWGWDGTGCMDLDPQFVNLAGGDYHLGQASPCRDAGDPAIFDANGSISDMGAYGGPGGGW